MHFAQLPTENSIDSITNIHQQRVYRSTVDAIKSHKTFAQMEFSLQCFDVASNVYGGFWQSLGHFGRRLNLIMASNIFLCHCSWWITSIFYNQLHLCFPSRACIFHTLFFSLTYFLLYYWTFYTIKLSKLIEESMVVRLLLLLF